MSDESTRDKTDVQLDTPTVAGITGMLIWVLGILALRGAVLR